MVDISTKIYHLPVKNGSPGLAVARVLFCNFFVIMLPSLCLWWLVPGRGRSGPRQLLRGLSPVFFGHRDILFPLTRVRLLSGVWLLATPAFDLGLDPKVG